MEAISMATLSKQESFNALRYVSGEPAKIYGLAVHNMDGILIGVIQHMRTSWDAFIIKNGDGVTMSAFYSFRTRKEAVACVLEGTGEQIS
jgi:hypothetical protein